MADGGLAKVLIDAAGKLVGTHIKYKINKMKYIPTGSCISTPGGTLPC